MITAVQKGILGVMLAALASLIICLVVVSGERDKALSERDKLSSDWANERAEVATAKSAAILGRLAEIAAAKVLTDAIANKITKVKNEEIADVRTRLADAVRMRKPAFCSSGPGPTAPAIATGTSSSTDADTTGGYIPQVVDGNIRALILQTEEVAATGRACQAFVRENGMAPPE